MTRTTRPFIALTDWAKRDGIPENTIRHWRRMGKGPQGFKIGRRVVFFEDEIAAWYDEQRRASTKAS